jgi:hypothetical protein
MAKQIFVFFLEQSGEGQSLDDVPLFNLLPYEDWMTETDVTDFVRKKFVDIFKCNGMDAGEIADFQDQTGRQVKVEEIAEATVAYAEEHNRQFWWVQNGFEDIFDALGVCQDKTCLISCMHSAAKARGWI